MNLLYDVILQKLNAERKQNRALLTSTLNGFFSGSIKYQSQPNLNKPKDDDSQALFRFFQSAPNEVVSRILEYAGIPNEPNWKASSSRAKIKVLY